MNWSTNAFRIITNWQEKDSFEALAFASFAVSVEIIHVRNWGKMLRKYNAADKKKKKNR